MWAESIAAAHAGAAKTSIAPFSTPSFFHSFFAKASLEAGVALSIQRQQARKRILPLAKSRADAATVKKAVRDTDLRTAPTRGIGA